MTSTEPEPVRAWQPTRFRRVLVWGFGALLIGLVFSVALPAAFAGPALGAKADELRTGVIVLGIGLVVLGLGILAYALLGVDRCVDFADAIRFQRVLATRLVHWDEVERIALRHSEAT